MSKKKAPSQFNISPIPSDRWRYYAPIQGNARIMMELWAQLPDEALDQVLSKLDVEEDFYIVEVKRSDSPSGAITQSARPIGISEALLRFGDARLLDAWLLSTLKTGHQKTKALSEALNASAYGWVDRIAQTVSDIDRGQMENVTYPYSPLFFWAAATPTEGAEVQYGRALDVLLGLPPYSNRHPNICKGLALAMETACSCDNAVALGVLRDRGVQIDATHLPAAISRCSSSAVKWLSDNGAEDHLPESQPNAPPEDWAQALLRAGADLEFWKDPQAEEDKLLRLFRALLTLPRSGPVISRVIAESAPNSWVSTLQAHALGMDTHASPSAIRQSRRI